MTMTGALMFGLFYLLIVFIFLYFMEKMYQEDLNYYREEVERYLNLWLDELKKNNNFDDEGG